MGRIEQSGDSVQKDIAERFSTVTRDLFALASQGRISDEIQCIPVPSVDGQDTVAFLLQFGDSALSVGADGAMFFVNGEGDAQQYYSLAPDMNNLVMAADILQRSSGQSGT